MGVISKYSNLYDKDNNFLHGPGSYTIQEVEALLDGIEDKSSKACKNTMATLMAMYEKYGNPHKEEIIQKINNAVKAHTTKEEVLEALNGVNTTLHSEVTDEE